MNRNLARWCLALASGVLTLVVVEVGWRVLRTRGFGPTTNPAYVIHDDRLGWRYRQGVHVRHVTQDFAVAIEIDGEGFRDGKAVTPSDGRERLMVLGDSLAFGWGVEQAETFAERLALRLPLAVYNRAVSGYGTDQEYLLLQRQLPLLAPGLVLVNFCHNDVEEVLRGVSYGKGKPCFGLAGEELVLGNVPVPDPWLERCSQFYRSMRKRALEARQVPPNDADRERGRQLVRRLLRAMAQACAAVDARLIVSHESAGWLIDAEPSIVFVDLTPALTRAAEQGPTGFAHDSHWNARGHAAVADAIAERLLAEGLVRLP